MNRNPFLLQLHCGERPDPELMTRRDLITSGFNNKPEGPRINPHEPRSYNAGLWTSTYTPDKDHQSDWIRWCIDQNFGDPDRTHWLLAVDPSARVLHLNGHTDYAAICREYQVWYQDYRLVLDWSRIARDYDAFHLDQEAVWAFRYVDDNEGPGFYSWDAESTVWFKWCFTEMTPIEPIPRIHWDAYDAAEQRAKILAAIRHVPGAVEALVNAYPEFRRALAAQVLAAEEVSHGG